MFRVGQRTRSRLPRGILVCMLFAAVARTSSATVYSRSLFSGGSCAISEARALRAPVEIVRAPAKLGIARVDNEGGFRRRGDGFVIGVTGVRGRPKEEFDEFSETPESPLEIARAASKRDERAFVNSDSGTSSRSASQIGIHKIATYVLEDMP